MAITSGHSILIFIPTFNDRERLEELSFACLSLGRQFNVLVIDDGSEPPITVLGRARQYVFRSPYNAGLGCSTNIAIDFAVRHQFDALVRIDADGQHPPLLIPKVLEPILSGYSDVTFGNRVNKDSFDGTRSTISGFIRSHIRFVANGITGLKLEDWHSGFMAFSRKALLALQRHPFERFPEAEILVLSKAAVLRITEVPVLQDKRSHGRSSLTVFAALRHLLGVYIDLIRHAIRGKTDG